MRGATREPMKSPATMTAGQTRPANTCCAMACPIMWLWQWAVVCAGEPCSLTALQRLRPLFPMMRTLVTMGRRVRHTRTWQRSAAAVSRARAGGGWSTAAPRTLRVRRRGTCLATCLLAVLADQHVCAL